MLERPPDSSPPPAGDDDVPRLQREIARLREAERRWLSIIEGPFDFVIIIDTDCLIRYINRVSFGFTKEDIIGRTRPTDFLAPEHQAEVQAKIDSVFATGQAEYYEAFTVAPINRWFHSLVSPFEVVDGKVQTVSIQSRDIHDQIETERTLVETQDRFEQLAANIADCFYLLDMIDNRALYVSPSVEKVMGVPVSEFHANPHAWMTTVHPEDRERVTAGLRRLMTEEYAYGVPTEFRVQHNGQTRWVQHRAFPVRNERQEVVRVAGIATDITERKEAAAALLAAQARYRKLLETLPIISYVVDPGQTHPTQYISPQIEWKLGYTQDEWTGDPELWESRIHPADRAEVARARAALLDSGEPLHLEYRLLAKDDVAISVREEATLVNVEGENKPRVHGVLLDVSETVDAQAAQLRAQENSLQLVQVQEEERRHLARELHDEVGQSLTMLRMLLEMAETDDPQIRTEKLGQARSSVQELMSKVHDLALDLRPGMLDDLGLLPSLVWLTDRVRSQSKLEVDFEHSGLDREPLGDDIATCVYRVVQEALTNCARHAGTAHVQVRVWLTDTVLNVQIEDDGCGFDVPSVLEGTGRAGLTGIRERATALGGEFELDSRPGEGCRILVHVPREGSDADG